MTLPYKSRALFFQELSKAEFTAVLVTNVIITLLNMLMNIFLCRAILKLRLLRNLTFYFILSLSLSDLCIGVFVNGITTVILAHRIYGAIVSDVYYLFLQVCYITFGLFSATMLLTIAFDRFLHIRHLNFYNAYMTKRKVFLLIFGNGSISIVVGIIFVFGILLKVDFYVDIVLNAIGLTLIFFIILLYKKLIFTFRNRVENSQLSNRHRSDLQLLKGVFAIVLSLIVCYLPFILFNTMIFYVNESSKMLLAYLLLFELYFWSHA